jgi:hypothetical protein
MVSAGFILVLDIASAKAKRLIGVTFVIPPAASFTYAETESSLTTEIAVEGFHALQGLFIGQFAFKLCAFVEDDSSTLV